MAAPSTTRPKPQPQDVSVDVRSPDGSSTGTATLAGAVFGLEPNTAVMHQVVTAQLAAARAGTHSTKTRAEVRGGGAKPWRQKGTGRARQGSIRAPHWTGGGVAHGPKPRDYRQRTPKKMVRLALCSALSDRAAGARIIVVDDWGLSEPKTKAAKVALDALGITPSERALIVLARDDEAARKSFRNLGERRVHVIEETELAAYDVLVSDWVVFTTGTLGALTKRLANAGASGAVKASSSGGASSPDSSGEERPKSSSTSPAPDASTGPADSDAQEGS